jgi:hypothetical protein
MRLAAALAALLLVCACVRQVEATASVPGDADNLDRVGALTPIPSQPASPADASTDIVAPSTGSDDTLLPTELPSKLLAPGVDPYEDWEPRLASVPPEARKLIERTEQCSHFGGEVSGDGSARDREVFAAMDALHCDTVVEDVAVGRKRWHDVPAVLAMLDTADGLTPPVVVQLPREAAALVQRVSHCSHLVGEWNGDAENDRGVDRLLEEYRCAEVETDLAGARRRWRNQPDVIVALDAVEAARP